VLIIGSKRENSGEKIAAHKKAHQNGGLFMQFAKMMKVQRLNGRGNVEPMLCASRLNRAYQ
jgi:hypothetical protein